MDHAVRVAIVGAGAMGSLFAWHLARGGAEIWVHDVNREHIEAIRRDGLSVRREDETRIVSLHATSDLSEVPLVDVLMVFVKFAHTRAALEAARPIVGPHTLIVTLQNGIGNVEIAAELYPDNPILYGLTTLTSELLGAGRIDASYRGRGETWVWLREGRPDGLADVLLAALVAGGVNAAPAPDIELRIWKKLVVNCCLNATCAITGLAVGPLVDRAGIWPILDGTAGEVVAAAQAKGVALALDDAHRFLRAVAAEARTHEPSMLIDLRNRRRSEIGCLNGAVLSICQAHGIDAPFNSMLYEMVCAIEASWETGG